MNNEQKVLFLFEQSITLVASLYSQRGGAVVTAQNQKQILKNEIELTYRMLEEKFDSIASSSERNISDTPSVNFI